MSALERLSPGRIWALVFAGLAAFWGTVILVGGAL